MKTNFHTHTYRCGHASGDVEDYVLCAIEADVEVLGISDHTPLPKNKWPEDRMSLEELDEYTLKIESAAEKHHHEITILKGMECDPHPTHMEFFSGSSQGFLQDLLLQLDVFKCYFFSYRNLATHDVVVVVYL